MRKGMTYAACQMWSTVTPSAGSPVPSARCKLAVCMSNNCVFVLGGKRRNQQIRDFWKYNIFDHTWVELKSIGDALPRLEDHTMVAYKDQLYVFGGEVSLASTGETPLWIYNITKNTWWKKSRYKSASQPQGCRGHTSVIYRGGMYVYGGYRDLKGSSSDFWNFDFESETWCPCQSRNNAEVPQSRHNHSAIVHDAAMWVYGGMTNLQQRADFWRWDFEIKHWSRMKCKGGPGDLHGHSACKIFSSMLLFGGEKSRCPQETLWRFHFATENWEKLTVNGVLPGPRTRHCALVVPSVLLVPSEVKKKSRPSSIPCHSVLTSTVERRQRPISSPPITTDMHNFNDDDSSTWSDQRDDSSVSSRNQLISMPKHSDSHNQLNFRMLKERISNVGLLKPSYSTYSALSNSSDSVQDDEPDEVYEMNGDPYYKVVGRSMSHSVSMMPASHSRANYQPRFTRDTISRDLLSVPNFQQITKVIPPREAKTPQSGLRGDDLDWPNPYKSSCENLTIDRFLQYYSLVPGTLPNNGFDSAFTDSEDSGIHGFKSQDGNEQREKGHLNRGLTDDETNVLLPGMVAEDYGNPPQPRLAKSATKRSPSMQNDAALIDFNSEMASTPFTPGTKRSFRQEVATTPSTNNCFDPYHAPKKFDSHRDFAHCLNNEAQENEKLSHSGVEMKIFQQAHQPEANQQKKGKNSHVANSSASNSAEGRRGNENRKRSPSKRLDLGSDDSDGGGDDYKSKDYQHFSMLVFGGREESQQHCLSKPLVIWRCEVWK